MPTMAGVLRRGMPKGEVTRQLYWIGNRSLLFVAITLGFIGMVMIYQACLQFSRVTGDLSQVGPQFMRLGISDFAPTLTAMMLATRVGAGMAAELASMKVTDQIDALRMAGLLPIDTLISPRLVACVIMTVVLSVFAAAIMIIAGGVTAYSTFSVNPTIFFDLSKVRGADLILFFAKSISYGAAIAVVSGTCGLSARGSSQGVGAATTAAVIGSSLAVIVLDFVWSLLGFIAFGGGT